MKKTIGILLVFALALSLFTVPAMADGNVPNLVLESWFTPSDPSTKPIYDAIAEFAAAHSDEFTLDHENTLGDELKAKIRTDVASNTVPDVFLFWGSAANSASLMDADVIIPFQEYLDESTEISADLFPASSLNLTSTSDGTLTTITTGLQYGVWLCNAAIYEEYGLDFPETLEDMIADAAVFNENGIIPLVMGSKGGNPAHEFVAEILGQMPGCDEDFQNLTDNYTIDTPNILNTLNIIETMRENKLFPADTVSVGDWGQQMAVYDEGKTAMIYAWTWQLSHLSAETAANTVIIDAPIMPGGTRDTSNFTRIGGDMGFMINKASWNDPEKHQAIIDLVDYLYSMEIQEITLYSDGSIPSRLDVQVDPAKVTTSLLPEIIEYAKDKESCANFPQACPVTEVWTAFSDCFDELFAGLITPEEFISTVDAELAEARE